MQVILLDLENILLAVITTLFGAVITIFVSYKAGYFNRHSLYVNLTYPKALAHSEIEYGQLPKKTDLVLYGLPKLKDKDKCIFFLTFAIFIPKKKSSLKNVRISISYEKKFDSLNKGKYFDLEKATNIESLKCEYELGPLKCKDYEMPVFRVDEKTFICEIFEFKNSFFSEDSELSKSYGTEESRWVITEIGISIHSENLPEIRLFVPIVFFKAHGREDFKNQVINLSENFFRKVDDDMTLIRFLLKKIRYYFRRDVKNVLGIQPYFNAVSHSTYKAFIEDYWKTYYFGFGKEMSLHLEIG